MPLEFRGLLQSKMGNIKSKKFGKTQTKERDSKTHDSWRDPAFSNDIHDNWAEDAELKILRRTIEHTPELFILNNLMMSVQFFENYEEEIVSKRQTLVSAREIELNARLPSQKHALIPDILQEQVSRNVDFVYIRPSLIPSVEPLHPIRVYIVHDNIEVTEQNFASPYCSVNETVTYSMQLKQAKHKGYVLLQRLEVTPTKKKIESSDEAIYSDGESLYSDSKNNADSNSMAEHDKKSGSGSSSLTSPSSDLNDEDSVYDEREDNYNSDNQKHEESTKKLSGKKATSRSRHHHHHHHHHQAQSNKLPRGSTASPIESVSSGYRSGNYTIDSDSESSYATTNYGRTKANLHDNGTLQFNAEIPRQCFQIYDPMQKRRQKLNNKDKIIKGVIHRRKYDVWYLNSSRFMDHFYHLFTDQLSELMGFDVDVQDGPQGATIYREKLEPLESMLGMKDEQFAVSPCIWCPWPDIAYEFLERPRATWPDDDVIEKIKEIGCYLIPEGYGVENINNNIKNLEWELSFPAAERYLETCMTYPQVRVYLMTLVLQKTFLRPIDSYIGLTDSHIRNQLFWLIEENDTPSKWLDTRMGESLLKLLSTLYRAISQDVPIMHDYFMKDKNIFQGKIYLLRTQKQLKRIMENPIMYLLHAMQNISHSRNFFPKLDYSMLLRILTEDLLTLINPQLAASQSIKSSKNGLPEKDYGHIGFWDSAKQRKERNNLHPQKTVTSKTLIDAKTSYDQVIEITVRCAEMEPRRISLLLDLFIRHFIKIAECCHKYGALSQKHVYIEHTERLCILLSEHINHKDDAKAYLDKLKAMKRRVASVRSQNDPPETPKRNVDQAIFTSSLRDRYKYPVAESQPPYVHITTPGESREYILDDPVSVYRRKHQTMAVVHEVEPGLSDVEPRSSDEGDRNDEKSRIISLTKSDENSIPFEDTYI